MQGAAASNPIEIDDEPDLGVALWQTTGLTGFERQGRKRSREVGIEHLRKKLRLARISGCQRLRQFNNPPAVTFSVPCPGTLQPGNTEVIYLDDEDEPSCFNAQSVPSAVLQVGVDAPGKDSDSPTSTLEIRSPGLACRDHSHEYPAESVPLSSPGWRTSSQVLGPNSIPPTCINPPSGPVSLGAQNHVPLEPVRTYDPSVDRIGFQVHEHDVPLMTARCEFSVCWRFHDGLQFGRSCQDALLVRNDLEPCRPRQVSPDDSTGGAAASPLSQLSLEGSQGSVGESPAAQELQVGMGSAQANTTVRAKVERLARASVPVQAPSLEAETTSPTKGPKIPDPVRVQAPSLEAETTSPSKGLDLQDLPDEERTSVSESKDMSDTEAKAKAMEDEMAQLWRDAALSEALGKPAPIEMGQQQKPVGCIHDYERNSECGQVCSLCGHVKAAMSVEFFAPLRTAKRRQKLKDERKDFLREDKIFSNLGPCRSQPEERPIQRLKVKIPLHFMPKMKEHQVKGFQFLVKSLDGRGGCIFQHAPGTGKTFLMIAFVKGLLTTYPTKKVLIVAPKVMVEPWKDEFQRWNVRDINILTVYDKSNETHDVERRRREILHQWKTEKSVLIVSYNIASRIIHKEGAQHEELSHILVETPDLVVLDEGHFVRTEDTNVLKALKKVQTMNRVILSGTLFQNSFKELYQILNFVKPGFLGNDREFAQTRMKLEEEQENDTQANSGMITQAMLDKWDKDGNKKGKKFWKSKCESIERTADSHAIDEGIQNIRNLIPFVDAHEGAELKSLPGLHEFVVHLKLQPLQADLVAKVQSMYSGPASKFSLTSGTTLVTVHPSLWPKKIRDTVEFPDVNGTASTPDKGVKADFVMQILSLCDKAEEKLIVFCSMLKPLGYIQDVLQKQNSWALGDKVLLVDGKATLRNDIIKRFNDKNDPSRVLLASIKACGEGVNLTAASRIILLEPVFNPSVTRQAVSRAFRVGQEKKVIVYHLVAANTTEPDNRRQALNKEWVSVNLFRTEGAGIVDNSDQEVSDPSNCADVFFQSDALSKHLDRLYIARSHC